MKSLTVASLTICTLLSLPVFGQIDIGVISGTVQDNSNSVVAGVKITATNEGNQATRQTATNSSGYYTFPNLMVGTYTISAEANGFQRYVHSGIQLNAAAQVNVSIQLALGTVTETVQVTEAAGQP